MAKIMKANPQNNEGLANEIVLQVGNTSVKKLKVCHPFFSGYGYKCFISYAESPSLFFIQLIENADKLQELDRQLK